ncbi:Protein pim1, partial [Tetrabaena socialis]
LRFLPGGVMSLALGQLHSLAVVGDGRVVAVGMDEHGSLGGGTAAVLSRRGAQQPVLVPGLPPSRSVAVGWKHSMAVSVDGRLFSWGWSGAMGAGTFQDYGG